jgi:hypothetical protein
MKRLTCLIDAAAFMMTLMTADENDAYNPITHTIRLP